jgi:hypothetical protein
MRRCFRAVPAGVQSYCPGLAYSSEKGRIIGIHYKWQFTALWSDWRNERYNRRDQRLIQAGGFVNETDLRLDDQQQDN